MCVGLVPVIPALSSKGHKFEVSLLCIGMTNEDYKLRSVSKRQDLVPY